MRFLLFVCALLSGFIVTAQQWSGSNDPNGSISRSGPVTTGPLTVNGPLVLNAQLVTNTAQLHGITHFRRSGSAIAGLQVVNGEFLSLRGWGANNPYIEWRNSDNLRQGYMGWNTNRLSLFMDNGYSFTVENGNMGVGTSSPQGRLHISNGDLILQNQTSGYPILWLKDVSGANNMRVDYNSIIGSHDMHVRSGAANNLILNDAGGRVAIATTSPYVNARLHVKSVTASVWGILNEAMSNRRIIGLAHNGDAGYISVSYLDESGYTPLHLQTANISRVSIDTEGNVGISNTNPAHRLDVNGTTNTTSLIVNNASPTIYTGSGSSELNRYISISNTPTNASASGLKAGGLLVADTYSYANPAKNDLIVKGKVGIGTPFLQNPNNYTLAVNGVIGARDVRVEKSSATWPDYVFSGNYELPSIQQMENYIQEHKHLKDVPSAEEVENDGYSLNAMDAILLKKVEELSLYIIQQQKEIDALKKKLEEKE